MRSKNSDWVIASALQALFSQTYTNFELLVVDSGSTDTTLDIVKQFPCRLVEIEAQDYIPGKVLNDAIELCDSEIIVFLNSDSVLLSPNSLAQLLSNFESADISAAFGRQLPRPEAHNWVRRDYDLSFPDHAIAPPWMKLSLPLAAMRRSTWQAHPFYTEAWASEDTEWGAWAARNRLKVIYDHQAITMHSHNYTLKEIYGRRFVEGEADAFIYQTKVNIFSALFDTCKSIRNDLIDHFKKRDYLGSLICPLRRFVYHWAYLEGNRIGNHRKEQHINDTSLGQKVVLSSA